MDTTGFFDYPTEPQAAGEHGLPGFLSGRGEEDWATLLDHSEIRLFSPGETVLRAGERDRALYLLVEGFLEFMLALQLRASPGSGWLLLDGAVTLALGVAIWSTWPSSSTWAVGTLVGVSMLFSGITRLMLSRAVRRIVA